MKKEDRHGTMSKLGLQRNLSSNCSYYSDLDPLSLCAIDSGRNEGRLIPSKKMVKREMV